MFYSIFKFELLVFAALSENLSAPGFIIWELQYTFFLALLLLHCFR